MSAQANQFPSNSTISGGDNRVARDDERQIQRNPVLPLNGVCRVYIAPPPAPENNEQFCRICHDTKSENNAPMISPCRCTGSSAFVHQTCIENWLTLSGRETCDLCNYRFPVYKTMKPVREVSGLFSGFELLFIHRYRLVHILATSSVFPNED